MYGDRRWTFVLLSLFGLYKYGGTWTLIAWFTVWFWSWLLPVDKDQRETAKKRIKFMFLPSIFVFKLGAQVFLCLVTWPPIIVTNVILFRDYNLPWLFANTLSTGTEHT